ncbi:MAG: methionine--tRNA ligase [Candidatus Moranbacteria bacterium]|nr:methionine--tRNA ligase [Candidatus Moranbacteria bacterium]
MKYYVTTPIYYVNANPHIGHTYTTLIADIMARYKRLRGFEVFFLTGTDEHGDKVAQKAKENGLKTREFVDQIAGEFKTAWDNLNIQYDIFYRTTSSEHKKGVEHFFKLLKTSGDIYEKDYQGLYCTGCESFKTDKELVEGGCPDHKVKPKLVKERNYFFNLTKYLPKIKEKIEKDEISIKPKSKKNEVLGLFKQNLEDFSITRENVNWGIDLPFDKNQKIYVWVEALMNYVTALNFGRKGAESEEFKKFWPADLHLMAKEIIKFHAIYWPAILMACKLETPKEIFVHGYFTINGEKMSKSLGNVIAPEELVKKWGVDATRYLVISQFPLGIDGDFSIDKMQARYESRLANDLGNLLSRTVAMMNKYEVPAVQFSGNPYSQDANNLLVFDSTDHFKAPQETIIKHFDNLKITKVTEIIEKIIINSNKYLEENKPWELAKTDPAKCRAVLQNVYTRLVVIAHLLEPFMPDISKKMINSLEKLEKIILFEK